MAISPRIVLIEPAFSGNVGSVARAMDNMDIQELRLVNPCDYTNSEARQMASKSQLILWQAQTYSSLSEAVADCHIVVGFTARLRKYQSSISSVWELHTTMEQWDSSHTVAFVFGRERIGLTNEEMNVCNCWMTIPTFGNSFSLNLAQAVMVVLYEYSKHRYTWQVPKKNRQWATSHNIEGLKKHFFEVLHHIGYIRGEMEPAMRSRFAELFARVRLLKNEAQMIRGFFHRIELRLGVSKKRQ